MAMFRYEAVDTSGKTLRGVMQAADQNDLAGKLKARGFVLRAAYDNSNAAATAGPAVSAGAAYSFSNPGSVTPAGLKAVAIPPGVPISIKSVVPPGLMAAFLRQLTTMVTSGMPLSQSMRENLAYVRHPKLKAATSSMADSIEAGSRLSESMARFPDVFPAHLVGCIVCGELGGDIDEYLAEAAADYDRETRDTFIGRIGWGLTKATLIQFWYALPLCFVGSMLIDMITGPQAGNQQVIINTFIGHFLRVVLPIGTIATVVSVAFWYIWDAFKRRPKIRYALDCYRIRCAPWGTIHRNRSIARFLRSMDRLLSAGVDMGRAWEASSLMCRDNSISVALAKGYAALGNSAGITERISRTGVLKMEEEGIINSGEKAGKIGESLSHLAATYENTDTSLVGFGRISSVSAFVIFSTIVAGILEILFASSIRQLYDYFLEDFGTSLISIIVSYRV